MTVRVVIVCGLPASGKSTFCRKFLKYLPENTKHIDYDSYLTDPGNFKQQRQAILETINQFKSKEAYDEWILLDDTFHLDSMRKAILHTCREKGFAFCVVFCETSLETCLARNRKRKNHNIVSESTLKKLFDQFERPDCFLSPDSSTEDIIQKGNDFIEETNRINRQHTDLQSEIQSSKISTSTNIKHQANIILCQHIHSRLTECSNQKHSKRLSILKKEFLKTQTLNLNSILSDFDSFCQSQSNIFFRGSGV